MNRLISGENMSNLVKRAVPFILMFFVLIPSCSSQKSPPKKEEKKNNPAAVNWHKYDEGLKLAEKENKKVMTFFYTDWCGYCKKMFKYTFEDEKIKKILDKSFISIKVNGESRNKLLVNKGNITERDLASQYGVRVYPVTWFLEPDGEKLSPMVGYRTAEEFANVLNYLAGDWYKKISFDEYLKKKDELEKKGK